MKSGLGWEVEEPNVSEEHGEQFVHYIFHLFVLFFQMSEKKRFFTLPGK